MQCPVQAYYTVSARAASGTGIVYCAIGICMCYAMPGTDLKHMRMPGTDLACRATSIRSVYPATRRSIRRRQYVVAIILRACYAMSGTDIAYAATHVLHGVQY
eukprot:3941743-Rhodomonas_salina.2